MPPAPRAQRERNRSISGSMGMYSKEELDKLRENIKVGLGKATTNARKWKPMWKLHEKLGLDIPELMTKDELDDLIQRSSGTPSRDPSRVSTLWTPYIQAEIARVQEGIEKLRDEDKPEKKFVILGGSSATGKSTFRTRSAEELRGSYTYTDNDAALVRAAEMLPMVGVEVDPDDAKLILPEYQAHLEHLTPGGASFTHDESRNVAEALRQRAVSLGLPIIYDTSGQFNNNPDMFDELESLNYQVEAIYYFAGMNELLRRVKERERRDGRGVPDWVVKTIQDNLGGIVPSLWKSGKLNKLVIIDTTDINNHKVLLEIEKDSPTGASLADESALRQYFTQAFWK